MRVDPASEEVQAFPLPAGRGRANLNTASFDGGGVLWFTRGQPHRPHRRCNKDRHAD